MMATNQGSREENHEFEFPDFEGFNCYQCGRETGWLAPDSRCSDCTRWTPEEILGIEAYDDDY